MRRKTKRFIATLALLLSIGIGLTIILYQLNDNIVFYHSPTEIKALATSPRKIRAGGLVTKILPKQSDEHIFYISDSETAIEVRFSGVLPALFRFNQGIIAEGYWRGSHFEALTLLAKHDETYKPPKAKR